MKRYRKVYKDLEQTGSGSWTRVKIVLKIFLLFCVGAFGARANSYSTNFPLNQNPISESGRWISGSVGIDWHDVATNGGHAFGTQSGSESGNAEYSDSTAVLSGSWASTQTVQATVWIGNSSGQSGIFEEVELRLRTKISPHSITGYEINASVSSNPNNFYCQIVRWNGPLGSFTMLDGRSFHVSSGDILKATASGNVITVFINGSPKFSVNDSTFTGGSPGVGFFNHGAINSSQTYGFSSFTAFDNGSPSPSPTPSATPSPTPGPSPYSVWTSSLLNQMRIEGIRSSQINATQSWINSHPPYP